MDEAWRAPWSLISGCCWASGLRGGPPLKGSPPPDGLPPSDGPSLRGLPPKGLSSSRSPPGGGPMGLPPPSREDRSSSTGFLVATSPSVYVLVIVTIVGDMIGKVHMCSGMEASRSHWFSVCDCVVVSMLVGEVGCSFSCLEGSGVCDRGSFSNNSLNAVMGESMSYQ